MRTRRLARITPIAAAVMAISALVAPANPATAATAATTVGPEDQQIKVLAAALATMAQNYKALAQNIPGVADIYDYGIGSLWKRGIDGNGTTIAVLEGWDDPDVARVVAAFDKPLGLPDPQLQTIYPAGPLPAHCPRGMVKLGSYGSCSAWAGELELDVEAAHLIAPYAKIVISATPADTEITDDAASQVAPPEMMKAVETIAGQHLADVISISDGTGESTYSYGAAEIRAQDPGELTAAAAGIPVLVGTGDCGVVQNMAVSNGQCADTSGTPDTAAWDDSPWVTAVGGTVPHLGDTGHRLGPDPMWHVAGVFSAGAGYSSVYPRPAYQEAVDPSPMRSVPDISMDASNGTSEATPLLAGVLALATQANGGDVGPVNQALYRVLGPAGAKDGIADVVSGDNSVVKKGKVVVPGFSAASGFDTASGWGTLYAPRFVPALVAAGTQSAARRTAARALSSLQNQNIKAIYHNGIGTPAETSGGLGGRSPLTVLAPGGSSSPRASTAHNGSGYYLYAVGFLPMHPVHLAIDGKPITVLHASPLGDVTDMIGPLPAGPHHITLTSLLLTESAMLTVLER